MTYEDFTTDVRVLLDRKAGGKGYTCNGPDGDNELYDFVAAHVSASRHGHALGEIIYKVVRFANLGNVEDMKKVAAWAFLVAKHVKEQE